MRYALVALTALTAVYAAPIAQDVPELTSLESLRTGSVTDLVGRDGTLPDLTELDTLPTGSVTDLAPREEASTEDYLVQGPDYEDASNDLLASLLDPGYGGDSQTKRDEDDNLDYSGNVSIVDDVTHLDLSDLLNPNDANGDSSIV